MTRDDGGREGVAFHPNPSAQTTGEQDFTTRGEEFEALLDRAPLGVLLVDADLRVRLRNPMARSIFGDVPGGAVGRDVEEVFRLTRDEASADALVRLLRHTLRTGEPYFAPEHVSRREGLTAYHEWRLDRIALPEGGFGVVCYFRDVSSEVRARRAILESQERFRTLAEVVPQIVFASDPTGAIEFVNRRWRDYTGLDAAEPGTGAAIVHADDHGRVLEAWKEAFASGRPFHAELRIRRAEDGAYRWFLSRAVPIRGADGRITRWFGTATDIDDQKRLEAALRDLDRRKDEFLAMLGHELRLPLAEMRATVGFLEPKLAPDEKSRHQLEILARGIATLDRLVDDLLDVSRITRGVIELRAERIDLRTVVQRAFEVVRTQMERRRHRVTVATPVDPLPVVGDPVRLEQIAVNLLTNASKFTDPGGRISLSVGRDEGHAEIRVRDSGIGIAPEMSSRIFELFEQAGRGLDRAQEGLGVGLTLVKNLVERHGGTIDVTSGGLGLGAEFRARLPLAPVEAPAPG